MPSRRLTLLTLAPLALVSLLGASFQERATKKEPPSFKALLASAQTAYDAGRFGACVKSLQGASQIALVERAKAIRAALPASPAGYAIEPDESLEEALANPMLGALALGLGSVVQQSYRAESGGSSIDVSVTMDSPMMQMFQMWLSNPAMLPKGSEVVKYGKHSAVLNAEEGSTTRELQIVIDGNLVEVRWPNTDEDALFAMFDQKAVDALAAALAN